MTRIPSSERIVLIRVARTGPAARGEEELYEATRAWWKISRARTRGDSLSPEIALAVIDGTVVEAYRIASWEREYDGPRFAFHGNVDDTASQRYVGMDVREYFPRGAANPLRYVNCPPEEVRLGADLESVREGSLPRDQDRLDVALKNLASEPLAAIMFGHRELFHSNLLGWFFSALPEAADAVFGPLAAASTAAGREVRREHQHIDLWMDWKDGQSLAIENKVFSLPEIEQLEDYSERIQKSRPGAAMVLLSLSAPPWGDEISTEHGSWTTLSYEELATRILDALDPSDHSYGVETMRHYAVVVSELSVLMAECMIKSPSETVELPAHIAQRIESPQLLSAVRKMRARHMTGLLRASLSNTATGAVVSSGFSHGGPVITCGLDVGTASEGSKPVHLGLQLQENQFRLIAIPNHLSDKVGGSKAQRVAWATSHPKIFDPSGLEPIFGPEVQLAACNTKDGINSFAPDFIYRYVKAGALTVSQLLDAADIMLHRLEAWKDDDWQ